MLSRIGVGTARMVANNVEHSAALRNAIENGVGMIDTAPNYGNGLAEELIGQQIKNLYNESGSNNNVMPIIVDKFGIQAISGFGSKSLPRESFKFFNDQMIHCIHPEFMREQLNASLKKLNRSQIDCYLVHSPEQFLMHHLAVPEDKKLPQEQGEEKNVNNHNNSNGATDFTKLWPIEKVERVSNELFDRLFHSFCGLEQEVANGKIKSYGVSSNSFSIPKDHPHFLNYEKLIDIANKAASAVGRETHSLSMLQFPVNFAEPLGLKYCAPWAKQNNLKVAVNRLFTGFSADQSSYRFNDSDTSFDISEYYNIREKALNHFIPPEPETDSPSQSWLELNEACGFLRQLITDLDRDAVKFQSDIHYEDNLTQSVIPIIANKFDGLDEISADMLQNFFQFYGKYVRSLIDKKTISWLTSSNCPSGPHSLEAIRSSSDSPLRDYSLRWILSQSSVDYVLLGTRKPQYIDNLVHLIQNSTSGNSTK